MYFSAFRLSDTRHDENSKFVFPIIIFSSHAEIHCLFSERIDFIFYKNGFL